MIDLSIEFVLIRPKYAGNIGAVARVMANFGLTELSLISPHPRLELETLARATHGREVLASMRLAPSWEKHVQIAGRPRLIIGTTAIPGRRRARMVEPRELPELLATLAGPQRAAILFGPEDDGLGHAEVEACDWLVHIPAAQQAESLNLSHAAAVLAYELTHKRLAHRRRRGGPISELEAFEHRARQTLARLGLIESETDEPHLLVWRRMLARFAPDRDEIRVLDEALGRLERAVPRGSEKPA